MRPRNLVIVVADAMRPDHLGCYGSARGNSPAIDALAREGIVFEDAFTVSPVTNVSISTLFTGCLPRVHGVRLHTSVLNRNLPTLAEMLKSNGYQTGAVISCATMDRSRGLARGFDFYDDSFGPEEPKGAKEPDPHERTISRHSGTAVNIALNWLKRLDSHKPFFLFLHLFDTHSPYDPPREYLEAHPSSYKGRVDGSEKEGLAIKLGEFVPAPEDVEQLNYLYGGEVNHTDRQVDRLFGALRSMRADRLLTVVTADHGVHLGERGIWGSGRRLYDREIRIPLIIHGVEECRGMRVPQLVSNADILPTLLELLAVSPPSSLNGRSRVPDLRNPEAQDDGVVYSETLMPASLENRRVAVRCRRWKLIAPVSGVDAVASDETRSLKALGQRAWRLLYRLARSRKGRREQIKRALDILFTGREKDVYRKIEDRDRALLGLGPELYDLQNDPNETVNLYEVDSRVARLLGNELDFFSDRFVCRAAAREQLSPQQLREAEEVLRQLGYK